MSTTKMITDAIKDASKAKTKGYDTTATVKRVEGSTVWVHIPGGVDETPVKRTINANIGDTVQVRVSDGSAWLVGNASAPPTDDTRANSAMVVATDANALAESASKAATEAWGYAEDARSAAATAETHADEAKASAENASEYAARALGNLSTVQNVTETLNWITAHGTMTLTTDVALDPTHVYFVVDPLGDYEVGGTHYSVVTEPDVADIGTYYVLTIDESLNNYVGTHLALTSEGLWLVPEAGGNRVLIATGGVGHTYEDAGTYIIDENDNISAQFLEDGTTIYGPSNTLIAHLGYGQGYNDQGQLVDAPFYTLGTRASGSAVGNYSHAEGYNTIASAYCAHAEGGTRSVIVSPETIASGEYSHAEGGSTTASAGYSHAEGYSTIASGPHSHAEGSYTTAGGTNSHAGGEGTIAKKINQTAIGAYNEIDNYADTRGKYPFIIGNGTSDNARSNALTVDWNGNIADGSGNDFIKCSSGTDNGWSYRKYPDGTYDAWQTKPLNIARSTAYGSLYRCVEQTMNMPSFNSGTDYIIAGTVGGGDWLDTNIIYATSFTYYMVRTASAAAQARTVRFYVHGTWS